MRALPRVTWITTGHQRDSPSKRPVSSVTLAARVPHGPVEPATDVDAGQRVHIHLENERAVLHSPHRPLTGGHSISASSYRRGTGALCCTDVRYIKCVRLMLENIEVPEPSSLE